jgi:uncharacterized protein (TIGR03437 family)
MIPRATRLSCCLSGVLAAGAYVGLLQVNLLVPDVPAGEQPLAITVGGAAATRTKLWVAPNY